MGGGVVTGETVRVILGEIEILGVTLGVTKGVTLGVIRGLINGVIEGLTLGEIEGVT